MCALFLDEFVCLHFVARLYRATYLYCPTSCICCLSDYSSCLYCAAFLGLLCQSFCAAYLISVPVCSVLPVCTLQPVCSGLPFCFVLHVCALLPLWTVLPVCPCCLPVLYRLSVICSMLPVCTELVLCLFCLSVLCSLSILYCLSVLCCLSVLSTCLFGAA